MSEKLLSQRAFAKEIGRSHVYVGRLVKEGKISLIDGKIPLDQGRKEYQASQRLGYDANRAHGEKQRQKSKKATTKTDDSHIEIPDDDQELPSTGLVSVDKVNAAFNKARLAEKTFQAKLKELDFKEKQGLLIPKETVEADASDTAEELRGLLFAIGPRIAPICEGKPAREIETIIESALNEALRAMKKSRFAGR